MSPFGGKAEAIGHKADIGAASADVLDTPFGKFARLQIITIEDLFAGKKPAMPPEDPAAGMMFRMASAITQNPDKEFEVKAPPLEVSYEE